METQFTIAAGGRLDTSVLHAIRSLRVDNPGDAWRGIDRGDSIVTVGPYQVGAVIAYHGLTRRVHVIDATPAGVTPTLAGQPMTLSVSDVPAADAPGVNISPAPNPVPAPPIVAPFDQAAVTGVAFSTELDASSAAAVPVGTWRFRGAQAVISPYASPGRSGVLTIALPGVRYPVLLQRIDGNQSDQLVLTTPVLFSGDGMTTHWTAKWVPDDLASCSGYTLTVLAQLEAAS